MNQNHLAGETSPYLLQHADNPVDWYPWGTEALLRAAEEKKLIFLSIGYSACHWCHVMERESFKDQTVANFLNKHYVSIKVDREERPDLDDIYMQAVLAINGQGGWPLNVFLTPDTKPIFGGTYFPPSPRFNLPSFLDVIRNLAQLWNTQPEKLDQTSTKLTEHLVNNAKDFTSRSGVINNELLEEAVKKMENSYDWHYGGWGNAPKFPHAMSIDFLLTQAVRGNQSAFKMADHALSSMVTGGMYDLIGGGFSRYSVDINWRTPHFEKMLYDNALLARAYLHGYLVSGNPQFRSICCETLDFLRSEIHDPSGGFYSSIDADSEGEEGKFYTWTGDEIREAIHEDLDAQIAIEYFGVTEAGNFEGKNILFQQKDEAALSRHFKLVDHNVLDKLAEAKSKLFTKRNTRIRPQTDTKVLTCWNALTLSAFAEAGKYLNDPLYIKTAQNLAIFLTNEMFKNNRLYRSWSNGVLTTLGYLEDYASLILGLLDLYQVDHNRRWYQLAFRLAGDMIEIFGDNDSIFYETGIDHEKLIYRPKSFYDNATPSGNAMAVIALAKLAFYEEKYEWHDRASKMCQQIGVNLSRYPNSFSFWLLAADFVIGPTSEIIIVGKDLDGLNKFNKAIWQRFRPRTISTGTTKQDELSPKILADRKLYNDQTTAYVCQYSACQNPVNTVDEMLSHLDRIYED